MNPPSEWVKEIVDKAGNKRVLLVEGKRDRTVLSYFLSQVYPEWNSRFVLHAAGGKKHVIDCIQDYRADWAGIVDKDEWSPKQIEELGRKLPRLKVLPRFCIENYFCVPEELWSALPPNQKQSIRNEFDRLAKPLMAVLSSWLSHGVMWRVIMNRRRDLLNESGFPAKLDHEPVTDLNEVRRILENWHKQLDPDAIISEYQQELAAAENRDSVDQLQHFVHGKKFLSRVVVPALNQIFAQASVDVWLDQLMRNDHGFSMPSDLQNFLSEVVGLF
ncbi:hypothetical protein DCC62_24125 [candidate division KSB1 bacterium]|nr:MAG: hypothetical protein DCC62_24125 [candidate division KSB1 bacterium]